MSGLELTTSVVVATVSVCEPATAVAAGGALGAQALSVSADATSAAAASAIFRGYIRPTPPSGLEECYHPRRRESRRRRRVVTLFESGTTPHGANLVVGVGVCDKPPDDVEELFGRILDPVDVLHSLVVDMTVRLADRQVRRERIVEADMVAKERVGTETDVLQTHKIHAEREVIHHRLERVAGMLRRQGRVRCRF